MHPGDKNYQSSAQPSVVYAVRINKSSLQPEYFMNPIGHGHYSSTDGELYIDLSSFTTALSIARSIRVEIKL